VAGSIRSSAVFAVLPVPLEIAKTAAVLEGAREEALARRNVVQTPDPPAARTTVNRSVAAPAQAAHRGAATTRPADASIAQDEIEGGDFARFAKPASRRPAPIVVGGLAALAAVAAVVAWFALRNDHAASTMATGETAAPERADENGAAGAASDGGAPQKAPAAAAPTPLPIKSGNIDDLLDQARTAFSERRYTDPKADSALVYYKSVLAQEPDNGEALEGLSRIIGVLNERLETALSENRTDDAAGAIAQLKLAETDPARLRAAEAKVVGAQISGALDSDNVDRAAALLRQADSKSLLSAEQSARFHNDLERRQADARVDRMADLVATRIRQGRLVDPANDSAQYYLAQLRKLPGSAERSAAAARDLDAAMRDRSRRDTRAQAAAAPVASEVDRLAKLVRDRTAEGRLLEPAQDSALYHLGALRAADAGGNTYAAASSAVSARLLTDGQNALTAGKLDVAQANGAAARQLG
jgi:hypothetical protein